MRIAVVAPPWYRVPPSGYGGIEWVVSLPADGLTGRGHEVTLFAPPGSETAAELVPPLRELPPQELIGDPWYEAAHAVSAYDRGGEFDLVQVADGQTGFIVGSVEEMAAAVDRVGDWTLGSCASGSRRCSRPRP